VGLAQLDAYGAGQIGRDRRDDPLEVAPLQAPLQVLVGGVRLGVQADVEAPCLADGDGDLRPHWRHLQRRPLSATVRQRSVDAHGVATSTTLFGAVGAVNAGCGVKTALWSSPGGLPSPSCAVGSASRIVTAAARTRSAVERTTSSGDLS